MAIRIETPEGERALSEFVAFRDRVNAGRNARWPAFAPLDLAILTGQSAFGEDRRFRPLVAREGHDIVARALAVVDARYNRHWRQRLGHVVMFEALPESREATRRLMDAACEWLAGEGTEAARAGFGMMEFPFVIDDYESLPPSVLRQNPAYYHVLLKDAGFESEQGWVDYKIEVRPELVARWESAVEAARRAGYELVPLGEVPASRRVMEFTDLWNEGFKAPWGYTPFVEAEIAALFDAFGPNGLLDASILAYRGRELVGGVWVAPETSGQAALAAGRTLRSDEKLNFLAIAVREAHRGRGVNLAVAGQSYLELVRRGATYLSYTLVLDDNWPSRRTAEKLGAFVCANYMTYRRNFRRR